jgi:streptogramin lyase/predicted Ser/Thr protein kinase
MNDPLEGSEFAGYRIERLLARGGMGVVYLARETRMGRRVALKLIAPELTGDEAFRARFERESRLAAAIDHPNVLPIYEARSADGKLFIAMRFVEGTDLRNLIKSEVQLRPLRAARIAAQVARALDVAHERGLVHRDVKPANVLISAGDHAYLADFGLSRQLEASGLTQTGHFVGTLDYISPEQLQGAPAAPTSDVYALGCVLYEALTGSVPFPRDTEGALVLAHVNEPPPAPSALSPDAPVELDWVIARAMAKQPEERFATAGELGTTAVAAASGTQLPPGVRPTAYSGAATSPGQGIVSAPPGELRAPTKLAAEDRAGWRRHSRALMVMCVALVAAVVVGVVLVFSPSGGGPTEIALPGSNPAGVAVGGGRVWVTDLADSQLVGIDPTSDAVRGTPIPLPETPIDVVAGDGSVWVVSTNGKLSRVDPSHPSRSETLSVGGHPWAVAVSPDAVWVGDWRHERITRVDPQRMRVASVARLGTAVHDVAAGDGQVWVAMQAGAQRLDPDSGRLKGNLVRTSTPLESIAIGDGVVWATSLSGNSAFLINHGAERASAPIPAGTEPRDVAVGEHSAWVTAQHDDEVRRFDAISGRPEGDPIEVGTKPAGIAFGEGSVWVANYDGESVARIGP